MDVDSASVGLTVGMETTTKEFLDVIKGDEDDQVRALTDEELSAVFRAVSSLLFFPPFGWF
jgi:hypothetical protein